MNIQQQVKNQQLKKELQKRKQQRIKQKLATKQRQKVNLDSSHLKTGKIQKTKIIEKKKFRTEVQKSRRIQVKIQQNANASTFANQSNQYIKILTRTRNYIKMDKKKLLQSCQAISSYAFSQKPQQHIISVQLTMQKPIQCSSDIPVMLRLAHGQGQSNKAIILVSQKGRKQLQNHHNIKNVNVQLMSVNDFMTKHRQDKKFRWNINKNIDRVFCQFDIFSRSKAVRKLIAQQLPIFPIDHKKVPYSLQQQLSHIPSTQQYANYLNLLLSSSFMVVKSGTQHRIKIRNRENIQQLAENVENIAHQAVAKLILKNNNKSSPANKNNTNVEHQVKQKGNKLVSARLKTQSSIPIDIYNFEY